MAKNISEIVSYQKVITVIGKVHEKSEVKSYANGQYIWVILEDLDTDVKIKLALFNDDVAKVADIQVSFVGRWRCI